MVKVLTKLRIDEVSAVDRAAGKNTKIVLMKRDGEHRKCGESFDEIIAKADDDDGGGSVVNHPVAQLAQLLVAAGSYPDISSALHFLLRRPAGVALTRTHKAEKE